jgi:hypothetical protein
VDSDLIREESNELERVKVLSSVCVAEYRTQNVVSALGESGVIQSRETNLAEIPYVLKTIIRNAIATVVSICALK